jgi:hypothetical protein
VGVENMGEEQFIGLIGSLGFPIVVASYLMVKLDKTLLMMSQTIGEFAVTNREMLTKLSERE